jgi:DNA helicase-2/ATP-dependent DNA helicase PcrA
MPWLGTFHSIGVRILRRHHELVGLKSGFTILDTDDQLRLMKQVIEAEGIDKERWPARQLASLVDSWKNRSLTPDKVPAGEAFAFANGKGAKLYAAYQARLKELNACDFGDLLLETTRLFLENPDVLAEYHRRFRFILVDEYQDTNKLQSDLIDLLAERHHNVMVVGDDAQSIYAWRGANFQNILKFPERYPKAKVYKIETNYRSTPEILNVANAAIAANVHQFVKELSPARKSGSKPVQVACGDASQQAAFVAQRVLELRDEGADLNNMAVLYRSHFHALELQLELTRRNIPFSITSGIRFFEQAHIKDTTAYLKLVTNPRDELSFKRLVQLLPGVGGKGADKLWKTFQSRVQSPESRAKSPVATALQSCSAHAPKKATLAWAQFVATISQLEEKTIRNRAAKMLQLVIEAGYDDYLKENFANYRSRLDDLKQLAIFAQQFESVEEFLSQMALLTNVEAEDEQPANREEERIRLSTIHQAKGLEFDVVFIIMLCDGMFPSARSIEDDDLEAEEEERRLFYVAITRARNELYLSYPLIRAGYGTSGASMQQPSRFLDEIPAGLKDEWNLRTFA